MKKKKKDPKNNTPLYYFNGFLAVLKCILSMVFVMRRVRARVGGCQRALPLPHLTY